MTSLSTKPRKRRVLDQSLVVLGAGALATGLAAMTLAPGTSAASSHREAPLIAGDPRADNTDVYAYTSPDRPDTVTLLANWIPFEEPNGGPNFYPFADDARYHIKIDNTGDGRADVTYTWRFKNKIRDAADQFLYNTGPVTSLNDPDLNFRQFYDLTVTTSRGTSTLLRNVPAAPSRTGEASMPNYASLRAQAVRNLPRGGKAFAGQAEDPFFADLRVFDLLYGGDLSKRGQDTLAGYNVNSVALQIPKKHLALRGNTARNPVIGVWSTTERRGVNVTDSRNKKTNTGWRQVSRLGNPLVNEVVVPLKFKDAFNSISPDQDRTVQPVVDKVYDPILPKLIEKVYGIPAPPAPRDDLAEIYLTGICEACGPIKADLNAHRLNKDAPRGKIVPAEELRLNMAVPPSGDPQRLGVLAGDLAGFPNGRRLADDVIDISLQAVEGAAQTGELVQALAEGDKVDSNEVPFGNRFPYLALPHTKNVNSGGGDGVQQTAMNTSNASAIGGVGALLLGTGGFRLWRRRTTS
ncbi:DUF4331 domain-containing protein [Streptomyces chryseus]|uniref:DUF4331 domain-containing protein n=1 Tax=Streptomyces chryseus TaxID=68186 RepID=A0ABQ3EE69_9ACTN|nr:DUF4331 domain-containing protein [Streptomyces chryseus]GGX46096.1 hypothetical protein GCM10010353_70950 [Streptomyces chryseus]GHB31906.1 hypothetical protein GCM10010346_64100 [Streptomyces chryseus]